MRLGFTFGLVVGGLCLVGCTSTLKLTRGANPAVVLDGPRQVALDLSTSGKDRAANAVFETLVGNLNLPSDAEPQLRERLISRLASEAGVTVCPTAGCGEGTVKLVVTESSVGVEDTKKGTRAFARVTARMAFIRPKGVVYQDTFWSHQTDRVELAGELLARAADGVAGLVAALFMPSKVTVWLPVEDGGPLEPGASMLLSGDIDGAERAFTEVIARTPDLAGAYYDLGLVAEVRGDYRRAAELHRQAAQRKSSRRYMDAAESAERDTVRFAPPGNAK